MLNELVRTSVPGVPIHIGFFRTETQSKISELHYHDEIELLSIIDGEISFFVDNRTYSVKKGEILFFNSRIPHSTHVYKKSCSYILIQFKLEEFIDDESHAGKYYNRFVQSYDTPFGVFENPELVGIIDNIVDEYLEKKESWAIYIKSNVYAMIGNLCRTKVLAGAHSHSSADIVKILPSINYIEQNYNREISLDEIASVQNLNTSYFCRLFKRASGSSFTDYLNFVRICKSEKLLTQTTHSVLEIAYDVGFASVSYFNRTFKKYKNCTPTAYRKAQYAN